MTTPSDRTGLLKPTDADPFSTEDLAANWETVDQYMGHLVVASALPSWGSDQVGLQVWQEDTGLSWVWNGSSFDRTAPKGHLGGAARITDLSSASAVMASVVATTVPVPRGGRHVEVVTSWGEIENTEGRSLMAIYRDGTVLREWVVGGQDTDVAIEGIGGGVTILDQPGEGSFTYSLRFAVDTQGGTATVRASSARKCTIDVVEV